MLAVAGIAAASFVLHMIFNNRYGYFRDEFDYIICGRHLAWGYVDQPPLVPVLSRIFLAIFGDSLRAVRLMPALAISATIILSGMIARELGGKRFAVVVDGVGCADRPDLPLERQSPDQQLPGTPALDGLRVLCHPRR